MTYRCTDQLQTKANSITSLCRLLGVSRSCCYTARHGLQARISRKGNCWDNAVLECFFPNLKMERVWQSDYANHDKASRDVADYNVGFYNNGRLHSSLGYLPPTAYEREMAAL